MSKFATAERVSCDPSDNFVFQRSRLAYHFASERISGKVLEIGTGSGYGIEVIAPHVREFISIDKQSPVFAEELPQNVTLCEACVPPLPYDDETFDAVISFQVIEHIEDDHKFVEELFRVLKKGGVAIISTPNKPLSLTRNPWHVREYSSAEFSSLLATQFSDIEQFGVVGNDVVSEYYARNKESVAKVVKLDIFDLQHRLPRWMLQIPYDILNRVNRRRLLAQNSELTGAITMDDYSVSSDTQEAYDLLFMAHRR